jgi:phosphatidate cytidylyltransferase
VTAEAQPKPQSDLKVRVISAVFMLAITAWEVWMGGLAFKLFVIAIALGLIWEWWRLACGIAKSIPAMTALMIAGGVYIGLATYSLITLRENPIHLVAMIASVIATDTGAYFAGRAIGGPKIAPSISPSKTWAGLCGGMLASAIIMVAVYSYAHPHNAMITLAIGLVGAVLAIVAQAGDFLESAMKRKAGVKDSSHLIPGHGGLLDRLDGLLAVAVVMILVINFR